MITGASTGADGGKAAEVVPEGAGTFLVQKFVKSKGPHAFIIRQVCSGTPACGDSGDTFWRFIGCLGKEGQDR